MCARLLCLWLLALSSKTPTLSESMNMDVWVVGISNQLCIKSSKQNFQKNKALAGKTPFFMIGSFCTLHSICRNIGFWQSNFVWKWCVDNLSTFN